MSAPSDEICRRAALRLQGEHPHWLIIWGAYSREFWAFPSLPVPRGTVVHAPHPVLLKDAICDVELAMAQAVPGWQSR